MLIIGVILALIGIIMVFSCAMIKDLSDTVSNTLWIIGLLSAITGTGFIIYAF